MDLSTYHGYFLESVTVATAPRSTAAIAMTRGAGERAVLTLAHVLHLAMDSPGEGRLHRRDLRPPPAPDRAVALRGPPPPPAPQQ